MLKIGQALLKSRNSDKPVFFFWYTTNNLYERLDVIEDIEAYNMLDTSNCIASLYRSGKEKVFGDNKVISEIYKIKFEASYLHVQDNKEVSIEDGAFVMTTSKMSADQTVQYFVKMRNGKIEQEYYQTELGIVQIDKVDNDTANLELMHPTNYELYTNISILVDDETGETHIKNGAKFRSYEEILRKYPEIVHVLDNDYVVVESYEQAEERLKIWAESKEQLKSYDIESLHTNWGIYSDNRITGVFLGLGTTWSTYFPFRQDNFEYNLPIEFLRRIFDTINAQPAYPEVILLGHNMKFEIEGFYQEFREYIRFDIDTYLLAVLVDPLIKKGSHTLKALTSKYEGKFYITLEQIFYGKVEFNVLPPEIVKIYGCPDATSPAKIYPKLMEALPKDEIFVMQLEMKLPYIKAMNEFYGIRMDQPRLFDLINNETYKVEHLKEMFMKIHHTSRNINSNDVLKEILYDKLRCKVEVRTSKGLPSTSKVAIDRIVETGAIDITPDTKIPNDILDSKGKVVIAGKDLAKNKYPSLVIYQTYKKCMKELGALKRLKDHSDKDFFKFYINQVGAGSNRQTSDAHQFSDTMKSCVLADSPYHQLVSCDWKQVELRILAGMAKQEDLMKLESDPNVDIHRAILSIIQGKPMYMISEEDRKNGKSVNFGVVYMMSEYGLARKDFGPSYTKENLNTERKKITDFYNGLPMIKKFLHDNEEFLRRNGYIKTAFKYYRYFPELLDPTIDSKKAASMVRSGNNTPVQGTGAGMLKIVETKVWDYIRKKGWDKEKNYDGVWLPMVRMILPIHDEILLSYDKSIPMEEITAMFKECMELDIEGFPPFFAAPAFINNWYDGKNSVYEVDIPFRDKVVEEYKKGNYLLTGHDYVETLQAYRNNEIRDYMADLIKQYKTVDEVAAHVTDDSLTHTLIETLIPDKKERKKLTHVERIHEATRRYMEQLETNGELTVLTSNTAAEDEEDKSQFMDFDEWAEGYTHIDQYGNLVTEEEDEDSGKDDIVEELLPVEERIASKVNVIYLMSDCLVDLTDYDISTVGEQIHQELMKLTNESEYYNLVYVIGEKLVKTGRHIGYIEDDINKVISSIVNAKGVLETNGN